MGTLGRALKKGGGNLGNGRLPEGELQRESKTEDKLIREEKRKRQAGLEGLLGCGKLGRSGARQGWRGSWGLPVQGVGPHLSVFQWQA